MKFKTVPINPRPDSVRRLMHASFERYALGHSDFPTVRFPDPVESFPRKSQNIARSLFKAWAEIDADVAAFQNSVQRLLEARIGLGHDPNDGRGVVITKVGKNMASIAVTVPGETPRVLLEAMRLEQFWATIGSQTLHMADGETVCFRDGEVFSSCPPDMILPRNSNVQAVFMGDKDLPALPEMANS